VSHEEKTRDQLIRELNDLRRQVDVMKTAEAETRDRCDHLEGLVAEHTAELKLLQLHLQRKEADCAQAEGAAERLRAEMEKRVQERTAELE